MLARNPTPLGLSPSPVPPSHLASSRGMRGSQKGSAETDQKDTSRVARSFRSSSLSVPFFSLVIRISISLVVPADFTSLFVAFCAARPSERERERERERESCSHLQPRISRSTLRSLFSLSSLLHIVEGRNVRTCARARGDHPFSTRFSLHVSLIIRRGMCRV